MSGSNVFRRQVDLGKLPAKVKGTEPTVRSDVLLIHADNGDIAVALRLGAADCYKGLWSIEAKVPEYSESQTTQTFSQTAAAAADTALPVCFDIEVVAFVDYHADWAMLRSVVSGPK